MAQKLLGTYKEAFSFLTNPVTKRTAWTDLEGLTEVCQQMNSTTSLEDIAGADRELKASQTLKGLDFSYPIPKEYSAGWRDWLDAFLANDPEIEILLFEEAIIEHQAVSGTPTDVDPSIIASAMS